LLLLTISSSLKLRLLGYGLRWVENRVSKGKHLPITLALYESIIRWHLTVRVYIMTNRTTVIMFDLLLHTLSDMIPFERIWR